MLAPTPQLHVSLLRQAHGPIVVTRDGSDLPSRVADNLFWLGRYSERLDAAARLLREAFGRLLEWEQDNTDERCLDDLFEALEIPVPPVAESPRARFFALRQPLLNLILESEHPDSLQAIFAGLARTGRAVRNHLGDDSWRLLNRLQQWIQEPSANLGARQARELLEEELMLLAAFCGLNNETMPHHQGWLFFDIGRYLERVLRTLDLFDLAFITARNPGVPLWEVVLTITDNLTAYRRRYRSALHPTAIIDLLLFDEGNPRSVGYQLRRLQRHIGRLQQPDLLTLSQRRGTADPGSRRHPATGRYRGAGHPVPRQHPLQHRADPTAGGRRETAAGLCPTPSPTATSVMPRFPGN